MFLLKWDAEYAFKNNLDNSMSMRSTANDDCLGIILMTALNAARPLPPTFQHPPSPSSPSSASLWSSWSLPPTSSMMIHHNDAILLAFHAIMICNGNLKLSLAKKTKQCEKSKKTNIKERERKIRRHKGRPQLKKNVFFPALPEWWGGGLPMPEFFGPLFRSAFLVNKKSLFLQKCKCIELLTVF